MLTNQSWSFLYVSTSQSDLFLFNNYCLQRIRLVTEMLLLTVDYNAADSGFTSNAEHTEESL